MQTIAFKNLYLLALELPGNGANALSILRMRLFARYGTPSARAFPECIPLSWHESAPAPGETRTGDEPVECTGFAVVGRDLYLGFSVPPLRPTAAVPEGRAKGADGLPECGRGVFMARFPGEDEAKRSLMFARELLGGESSPPPRFRPTAMTVFELPSDGDVERSLFWRAVSRDRILTGRRGRLRGENRCGE